MRLSYKTLRGEGVAEYEEKRSRFIGTARPAASESEALAFLGEVRQRYKDVSHHVYAYLCGENGLIKRCSDAGEPQGTAGAPVLEVIEKSKLTDVAIAVTRYYGGINLGAAGLIRAYGKTASLAVGAAGIVKKSLARRLIFLVEYSFLNIIRNYLDKTGYTIAYIGYGVDIELTVIAPYAEVDALCDRVAELTAGAIVIEQSGDLYIESDV